MPYPEPTGSEDLCQLDAVAEGIEECPDTPCGSAAGRPRSADIEARMQNLVATAARLFIEKGYTKVSLEMIAREAHVAVRTIYVKFGGKTGLFNAVLVNGRERFFSNIGDMQTDTRPIKRILSDFSMRFIELVTSPGSLNLQRMVIAEARTSPELARTFFESGPAQTRIKLAKFFARPDIRMQLRDDVPQDLLPVHLINCILGDLYTLLLFDSQENQSRDNVNFVHALEQRLALFYRAVLRQP